MAQQVIVWGVVVVLMTAACFWRPRLMRGVTGVFFAIMGLGVHGVFVATDPASYVVFARQALIPFYGKLAEAVVVGVTPVVFGLAMLLFEVVLAALILGRGGRVKVGLWVGMAFLIAITPLGYQVLPNAVLAVGLWRLSREEYHDSALAELRQWRAARRLL